MPNLLTIRALSRARLLRLLEETRSMQEILARNVPKVPALRGKRVALLFFEPSTRTKLSFELAAKSLGADVMSLGGGSSMAKGESLLDTMATIRAMGADLFVVRDGTVGAPAYLAEQLGVPVINAGDGTGEHPTQALIDLSVLQQTWGEFRGKTLAIVGDLTRSRVARSHLWAAEHLGHRIRVVAPRTFVEPGLVRQFELELSDSVHTGLAGADAVLALRVQKERHLESGPFLPEDDDYFLRFGVTQAALAQLPAEAVVLHPGPVNRGVEMAPDVIYDPQRSRIEAQVAAGVAVRMAVLYWALGGQA